MKKNSRRVYSTDVGRIVPEIETQSFASSDGIIRVSREIKGRNGKPMTVAAGFDLNREELKKIAKNLKQLCGTGGTVKDSKIEIQGDQKDKVLAYLQQQGFRAKPSGG